MSQTDSEIRKRVTKKIVGHLGGYPNPLSPERGALAITGFRALRRYFNEQAAEVSGTRVVFDGHLRTHDDTVGLGWTTTGIGQNVRFQVVRQPDKTYSIFLIRKTRSAEWARDPRAYILLDAAHGIPATKLAKVVSEMYTRNKKNV